MGGERSGGLPCTFILFGLFEEVALHRLLQHENLMTMVGIFFTMYCNFVTMKCELVTMHTGEDDVPLGPTFSSAAGRRTDRW